jgi:regulatory protein
VVSRLRRRGLRPDAVTAAVGRLEEAGLLDDAKFAESYARARVERGYGRSRIRSDLAGLGVDRRVAERAVEAVVLEDRGPEIEALARKRAQVLRDLPEPVRLRRIVGFLARRGFGGAAALAAARAALREPPDR